MGAAGALPYLAAAPAMTHDRRVPAGAPSEAPGQAPGLVEPGVPVELFRSAARKPCKELALVLQALGIPHGVQRGPGGFQLMVPLEHARRAAQELGLYREENVGWPPPKHPVPMLSRGVRGAVVYALLIAAFLPIGHRGLFGRNFWEAGKLVASRVNDGEWWRTVTALTLHGDVGHLVGNLIFGCAFAVLASHTLGSGITWLGTLLAGAGGNLANAWLQGGEHASIGASTAVFGCLGLMASYEWVRRHALHLPRMRRFAPMMAGAALLGFLGMGGSEIASGALPRTDVLAHVTGLAAGVVLGFLTGRARLPERLSTRGQGWLAGAAAALVAGAWAVALVNVH